MSREDADDVDDDIAPSTSYEETLAREVAGELSASASARRDARDAVRAVEAAVRGESSDAVRALESMPSALDRSVGDDSLLIFEN